MRGALGLEGWMMRRSRMIDLFLFYFFLFFLLCFLCVRGEGIFWFVYSSFGCILGT